MALSRRKALLYAMPALLAVYHRAKADYRKYVPNAVKTITAVFHSESDHDVYLCWLPDISHKREQCSARRGPTTVRTAVYAERQAFNRSEALSTQAKARAVWLPLGATTGTATDCTTAAKSTAQSAT